MSLIWLRIHQMILLSGYKHAFFRIGWQIFITTTATTKNDERARTFTTFFSFMHTFTYSMIEQIPFIYLLCWPDEFVTVVVAVAALFSIGNSNNSIANTITERKMNSATTNLTGIYYVDVRMFFSPVVRQGILKTTANVIFQALRCAARIYSLWFIFTHAHALHAIRVCVCCLRVTYKNLVAQTRIARM